ncbi:hypothetical protein [Terriglobus saanensis]|uniref:Uncharacterized protein n=1 Tax=Terriglobus saanensis (strain ATCC BAA-1853 / DSM 23119 / SP1PR4) TaxID=401053 RepID=E8V3Q5_TERSS|nr:hypothetical protein [Terriglobus saanensis]ADV84742.1 hypothetical protein AciPR4_3993 [Terriglobus saanensis SP1PR4]
MKPRLLLFAIPVFWVSTLLAQVRPSTVVRKSAEGPVPTVASLSAPTTLSELIKVTIYPSRNEVVPTGSYGVYADLENISAFPVMIFPNQTTLVVLPEASQPSACVNWEPAIFPTESPASAEKQKVVDPAGKNHWDNPLLIERGEHYLAFWDLEPASKKNPRSYSSRCELPPRWYSSLGFVPGDYAFTVEGNAYALQAPPPTATPPSAASTPEVTPAAAATKTEAAASSLAHDSLVSDLLSRATAGAIPAHRFSETKTLHVGLSQLTTLFAAMIGAFIAYWVVALKPGQDWDAFILVFEGPVTPPGEKPAPPLPASKKWLAGLSLVRNAFLAAVLGGVVTIVASRLSDTHFPVKVSVNDWWGALTIGFVAYFVGNKFINTLSTLGGSDSDSSLGKTATTSDPNAPKKDGPKVIAANE